MYCFPKDLYTDVRIEDSFRLGMECYNGEMTSDADVSEIGAMIRVYDGEQWYSASTNDIANIQAEIDNLATLATPNPGILEDPMVKRFQVHEDCVLSFAGDKDIRKTSRDEYKKLIEYYRKTCEENTVPEMKSWLIGVRSNYKKTEYYSSKGTTITTDSQTVEFAMYYQVSINEAIRWVGKEYRKRSLKDLFGYEKEILAERDKMISFMKEAVNIEPGDYTCVFSPIATALFTHESFGHKSESDYMLNDKALQEEWVMGKKAGNEKVSIYDKGNAGNYGDISYDAEGTPAGENWLIRDGVLCGRLHNAKSAAILDEELTGNARAENYNCRPIVRMTNTYMKAGQDDPEEMIRGVKDGIFVEMISHGTGMADFSIVPTRCYRIREGKIAEAVRVNIIMGNVFRTLFDVDAVGTDFTEFETFVCGKMGQSVPVGVGGPSIRIQSLKLS